MNLNLSGRVALVTGASRGLGRASAEALGAEGARVALAARDEGKLDEVGRCIREAGGDAMVLPMDLSDENSITDAVRAVVERWGRIDILIANAPGPRTGAVAELSEADWRLALDLNVLSMVRLLEMVVPIMRHQASGRIIFVATVGILMAQPGMVLSNATRLAVYGLAKTMALELAPDGILVNIVCPGPIETDRMRELIESTARSRQISRELAREIWLEDVPLHRMGRPEDFGSIVAFLCSDACSFMTGSAIAVDGGKATGY
jgi:3-oxoacyl-[acyl-carrier protein] reductase